MADISLRGELWDNDSADVLRWWGWRDITAPMDIAAALEAAGGEDVTLLINSPGGDMSVGLEIRSMLRRYKGNTTALFQGYGASAATLAATGCRTIQSEPGALLCYHNPSGGAEGDFRDMRRAAEALRNARDCILEVYTARGGTKTREELMTLMDKDIWITPTQAMEYGHGGGGSGVLCGDGVRTHPADGGHAGTVSGPCCGPAGGRGPEGTGQMHSGTAQGAC
mgnify:CR=1 FL=1